MRVVMVAMALVLACGGARAAEVRIVASSDAPVLDGEFAGWNFGRSPVLEAGWTGGIYNEHRGASLVRFDVAGVTKVERATLRLYRPRDFWQMRDVTVRVSEARGNWAEGKGFAEVDQAGVTWEKAGKIEHGRVVDQKVATVDDGGWMEFALPAEMVRRWVERPETNGGVWVDVEGAKGRGDHVSFCSSECYLAKGPELVIEGESSAKPQAPESRIGRFYELPTADVVTGWLAKGGRLAGFAKVLAMNEGQAAVFCLFDTDVRRDLIVVRWQRPEQETFGRMLKLIAAGDEAGVRRGLTEVREQLLVWEYVRQTCWYTAGDNGEVLSGRQLADFYVNQIYGPMATKKHRTLEETWIGAPGGAAGKLDQYMESLKKRLKLSEAQVRAIEPGMAECIRLQHEHAVKFVAAMHRAQKMLSDETMPQGELFRVARELFFEHEMFLYYQSIYNTPRWEILMEHAPVMSFAQWVVEGRYKKGEGE